MLDPQPYLDRMLENENLTGDLKDEDAQWLLDWGAQQVKAMAAETSDPEALSQKAGALTRFMHSLSRLGGSLPYLEPAKLPLLAESYAEAFGASRAADQAECIAAAARASQMEPGDALGFLLRWVQPPYTSK
jgi:hypothetical protein